MIHIPLFLTMIRCGGAILFPFLMMAGASPAFLCILYPLLAITDWLDGMLARALNDESMLGRLLDPLADKLLVFGPLMILALEGRVAWYIVYVIVARELFISTLREYGAERKISLPVQYMGKIKTVVQMSYVAIRLCYAPAFWLAAALDSIVIGVTLLSAITYTQVFARLAQR